MARVKWYTHDGALTEGTARITWLKAMYGANIVVNISLGLAVLGALERMRRLLRVPVEDPIHFGLAGILGRYIPLFEWFFVRQAHKIADKLFAQR